MDFILGCNYWASNAGTEMWNNFDAKIIDNDIRKLSEYGIKFIRAFPNWRDFQPIKPLMTVNGKIVDYCTDTDSNIYYLDRKMQKFRYEELKNKVFEGADLYISIDNGILTDFESFVGLKVIDSYEHTENKVALVDGEQVSFSRLRNITVSPAGAQVLAYDNDNNPFITVNHYGKGRVFFVNAPLENNLVDMHNAFVGKTDLVYRKIFNECGIDSC